MSKTSKKTIHQRRPNLRPATQIKLDAVKNNTGWSSDAEAVDRSLDFFITARGIQVDLSGCRNRN